MPGKNSNGSGISELGLFQAEKIVESFRQGTVPNDRLDLYTLGRKRWLDAISNDLEFVSQGGSKVRFIAAPYGGGKTHFLRLVTQVAHQKRFLVSNIELDSREAPFDRFEVIFAKIMQELIDPAGRRLEEILGNWAKSFPHYGSRQIEETLRTLAPALDFRAALRSYLQFANTDSPVHREWLNGIVSWLEGSRPGSALTKVSGIRAPINIGNVSEMMTSFLKFLRGADYSGLVLVLDEAEAITSLSQSKKRDEANQTIRKLLDNADENIGFYLVFATTPRFLNDPAKGAQSYPALWSRIRNIVDPGGEHTSLRSIILTLPSFTSDELTTCAERIVETHGLAYQWNSSDVMRSVEVDKYVAVFQQQSDPRKIRDFIRGLINILDLLEENPNDISPSSLLDDINFSQDDDE